MLGRIGGFFAANWKTVAVVAVGTVLFAAVVVLTGGAGALLAPTLGELVLAGVVSGAGAQATSDLLGHKKLGLDLVEAGVVAGVLTVATAGASRFVPGLATPLSNPVAQRAVVAAAGAAGGAGARTIGNALHGRPLGEGVPGSALQGGVVTLAASEGMRLAAPRILPELRGAPPEETGAGGPAIDPVTRTTMDHYGMTPDTILYRVGNPARLDLVNMRVSGNPESMALVEDPYRPGTPHPCNTPEHPIADIPRLTSAKKLGPSLNVALEDPSGYASGSDAVLYGIKLGDVLAANGRIYPDVGAVAPGIKPLIVTFDGSVPVQFVRPVEPPAPSSPGLISKLR